MSTEKCVINSQQNQGYDVYTVEGQPVGQTVVVVNERNDFVSACLGTGFCGLVGLCFFGCCCNTPTGRVGAATGCIINGGISFILYLVLLIIYENDCDGSGSDSGVCRLPMMRSIGILIAYVVVAAFVIVAAILFRKKYIRELQQRQNGMVV